MGRKKQTQKRKLFNRIVFMEFRNRANNPIRERVVSKVGYVRAINAYVLNRTVRGVNEGAITMEEARLLYVDTMARFGALAV